MIEISVPRTRSNGSAGAETLGEYGRRMPELDAAITEAYVSGVSTRRIGEVTEALMGERVIRSTVSRVTRDPETEVEKLRKAPITDPVGRAAWRTSRSSSLTASGRTAAAGCWP